MGSRTTLALASFVLAACGGGTAGSDSGPGSDSGTADSGSTGIDGGSTPACPATLPEVAVRFSGCEMLTACGGDPTGVWVYSDVCVEGAVPDVTRFCAEARIEDLMGSARGCIVLDGASVHRNVSGEISATLVVPTSCTFGMGCAPIEMTLGTTCTLTGGECRCPFSTTWSDTSTDTYTVSGSVLTTGDGEEYDFCVMGTLRYDQRGMGGEPGVMTLTP